MDTIRKLLLVRDALQVLLLAVLVRGTLQQLLLVDTICKLGLVDTIRQFSGSAFFDNQPKLNYSH